MSRPRRSSADRQRRGDLHLVASGLHPATATVAVAHKAPSLTLPRALRARRGGLAT